MHTLSSPKVSIFVFKNIKIVFIARSTIPTLRGPPKNVYEGTSHKKWIIYRRGRGGTVLLLPETRVDGAARDPKSGIFENFTRTK